MSKSKYYLSTHMSCLVSALRKLGWSFMYCPLPMCELIHLCSNAAYNLDNNLSFKVMTYAAFSFVPEAGHYYENGACCTVTPLMQMLVVGIRQSEWSMQKFEVEIINLYFCSMFILMWHVQKENVSKKYVHNRNTIFLYGLLCEWEILPSVATQFHALCTV
jgi:hypothetical protein